MSYIAPDSVKGWGLSVTFMGFVIDSRGPRFACAVGGLLESGGLLLLGSLALQLESECLRECFANAFSALLSSSLSLRRGVHDTPTKAEAQHRGPVSPCLMASWRES